jgi:putative endonuclease
VKQFGIHNYFVYILTNQGRSVLYIGVTNDIRARLQQHIVDVEAERKHFSGQYNCVFLIYYERFDQIEEAIKREKQLKRWTREKKERLINTVNPEWKFLNEELW